MSHHAAALQVHNITLDAKATGATKIFTTDNGGRRFIPLVALFETTAASGVLSVATVSIGTNASSYNDVLAAAALTGVTAANNLLRFNLGLTAISSLAPNTDVFANVTIGATGTSQTVRVSVIGYYE